MSDKAVPPGLGLSQLQIERAATSLCLGQVRISLALQTLAESLHKNSTIDDVVFASVNNSLNTALKDLEKLANMLMGMKKNAG